jgi:hypothetical protein
MENVIQTPKFTGPLYRKNIRRLFDYTQQVTVTPRIATNRTLRARFREKKAAGA